MRPSGFSEITSNSKNFCWLILVVGLTFVCRAAEEDAGCDFEGDFAGGLGAVEGFDSSFVEVLALSAFFAEGKEGDFFFLSEEDAGLAAVEGCDSFFVFDLAPSLEVLLLLTFLEFVDFFRELLEKLIECPNAPSRRGLPLMIVELMYLIHIEIPCQQISLISTLCCRQSFPSALHPRAESMAKKRNQRGAI